MSAQPRLVSVRMAPEVWEQEPITEMIPVHAPTETMTAFDALLPGPADEPSPPVKQIRSRIPWAHLGWVAVLAYTLGVVQGSLIGRYL